MQSYHHRLDVASLTVAAQTQQQPIQSLMACEPLNLEALEVNILVLQEGALPSTPTSEADQFYILLSGLAQVTLTQAKGTQQQQTISEPGSTLYQPPGSQLQLRSNGSEAAVFLQAHLWGKQNRPEATGPAAVIRTPNTLQITSVKAGEERGTIVDAPTPSLRRLYSFLLKLKAGTVVHDHQHRDHGLLLLFLEGNIEMQGELFAAPTLLYYKGGEPHGFRCTDDLDVKAVAIEFYQEPPLIEQLRSSLRDSPIGNLLRGAKTQFLRT